MTKIKDIESMSVLNSKKVDINEKDKCILERLWIYQNERFPVFQNGLMISVFTFSAISYSRICRGENGFISLSDFIVGTLTSFGFFLLLRLFDEFKDAKKDATYQPYRAVPRGLVSLNEIGWLAFIVIIVQMSLNITIMPLMLGAYFFAMLYMVLMSKEFFVSDWLRDHPVIYMLSHMLIMPMIDFYTTGLDWINSGAKAPHGLIFFLTVTFLNGIVIEIGRKIKGKDAEEYGVETYSVLWGSKKATLIWFGVLLMTFVNAYLACYFAGFGEKALLFLVLFICLCSIPVLKFIHSDKQQDARYIEIASGLWTIGMYLTLGGIPMLINLAGG